MPTSLGNGEPVRILLVEDSPEDAELILDELEQAGLAFEARRVEDEAGLREALDGFKPDLILSDLSLPTYSGHDALALARTEAPETPFIFVSGTIGEETAVEALRQGAADYVLKHNTVRLPSAVVRAVREARSERERRQAEAELLRAQRMETLALLTSGLGHDLRNVLQPLLIVPAIMRDQTADPQLLSMADLVHDCASRGLEMVGSMLSFARGDGSADGDVAVDELFKSLRLLLKSNLPRRVELVFEGDDGDLVLRGNRTEIQQTLLNLALNAIQAMPEGGRLTLGAQASDRGTLVLSVADTGIGMDEDTQERLFTPFFTTKSDGTGLGLHSSRRIVESHGGWIEVDSAPGKGTRFELHFPTIRALSAGEDEEISGHGDHVLIVDEVPARAMRVCRQLVAFGFECHVANDGASALQHIASSGGPSAVVIDAGLNLLSTVQTLGELERRGQPCPVVVLTVADRPTPSREDYPPGLDLHFLPVDVDMPALARRLRVGIDTCRASRD